MLDVTAWDGDTDFYVDALVCLVGTMLNGPKRFYPRLRRLAPGDHIRFVCGRDDCLTRVKRVAVYDSFEEMLDAEGPANVNPDSPREQQLTNIRRIYGPEKEALGVLAIEIELVGPADVA